MKNKVILLLIILISTNTYSQIVDIPDTNFKFILTNLPCVDTNGDGYGDSDVDTNDDGEIQVTEAETVLWLIVGGLTVNSIEGLQSFINLVELRLIDLDINNLDFSQNIQLEKLSIGEGPINSIDLNQNINLIELRISHTQITELVLTNNQQLLKLTCASNPITTIDISQNVNLIELNCTYSPLTEIDVSQNIALEDIGMWNNQLTFLDINQLYNLKELNVDGNQLTELDVSNNPNLEEIIVDYNSITSLDVSQNPNLFRVTISYNNLINLNLKNGNTNNIFKMWAHENSNLTCIQVDDVTYPSTQVCTSWDGWCKDETAVYSEDCNLGLEDILTTQITLYPNPAQNVLLIQSQVSIKSILVYDVLGNLVLEQQNAFNQIELSHLKSGLLFIKLETDQGILVKKVLKK